MLRERNSLPSGELRLEIGQLQRFGPVGFRGSSENFKDFEDLVDFGITHEQRSLLRHLRENATEGPHIDTESVLFLSEENFWRSVPECDYFVSVGLDGESESASQSKISQLDATSV